MTGTAGADGLERQKRAGNTRVSVENLTRLAVDMLGAVGVPSAAAHIVADGLVSGDVEGVASHGVLLLPMYIERIRNGSVCPTSEGRVIEAEGAAVVLDAENGLGQVTAQRAVGLALDRAVSHGVGTVVVRNGFHVGMLAPWVRRMAEAGCIGIAATNTRPLMPAPGGAEPVVGNNPIALAAPTGSGPPIVVDLALSAGAMGKIRLADARGETIPEGWATSPDGRPTTDPEAAIAGMLLPVGGPKGFGLAMMIELLAGGLSGGAMGAGVRPLYGAPSQPYNCAHIFLALRIEAFRPLDTFKSDADVLADAIRSSRSVPGMERPRVPGDRSAAARARNAETCEIADATLAALQALAHSLRVPFPKEMVVTDG